MQAHMHGSSFVQLTDRRVCCWQGRCSTFCRSFRGSLPVLRAVLPAWSTSWRTRWCVRMPVVAPLCSSLPVECMQEAAIAQASESAMHHCGRRHGLHTVPCQNFPTLKSLYAAQDKQTCVSLPAGAEGLQAQCEAGEARGAAEGSCRRSCGGRPDQRPQEGQACQAPWRRGCGCNPRILPLPHRFSCPRGTMLLLCSC